MPIIINRQIRFITLQEIREKTGYELQIFIPPYIKSAGDIFEVVELQRDKRDDVMYVKLIDSTGLNMPYKEIVYSAEEFFQNLFGINTSDIKNVEFAFDKEDERCLKVEYRKHE